MRWTATISRYEQRHPASTVGNDAFCRKSHHSWLEHYTPFAPPAPNAPQNRSPQDHIARPSGRQDSNLRPLVPQISPHFPMSAEFDLEWFCGELVGMTTRAWLLESVGIASTSGGAGGLHQGSSPPSLDLGMRVAVVTIRAFSCCSPHHCGPSYRVKPKGISSLAT
jgi:hypothetical protein